jgi:hypothetical protein
MKPTLIRKGFRGLGMRYLGFGVQEHAPEFSSVCVATAPQRC